MRWTEFFLPTHKEIPSEAEVPSHILMIRAGLMLRLSSGVYSMLPFGLRATQKVAEIVRQEMNRIGGLEILMPVLSPAELWMESGRWDVYGRELMRVKDRHDRFFALGPTHEEVVTDIIRREIRSYRQIPLTLYQIQTKFRDEIRPRFGVVRAREFMMKDAYSFHRDDESLAETYDRMFEAYTRIFKRCGLRFGAVEADSGAIGGDVTHEFMVFADTGESQVWACDCGYAATSETAEGTPPAYERDEALRPLEQVSTPGMKTVEEVTAFLNRKPWELLKTIVYKVGEQFVGVLIRGDREINEVKLQRALKTPHVQMATAAEIESLTGGPLGFSGPVGLKGLRLIADHSVSGMHNMVTGANAADAHYINVNLERDFTVDEFHDVLLVDESDLCKRCGQPLSTWRGIEVGQIFKLGPKYSEVMKATFLDEQGEEHAFVMGCYGIGVTRTVAAAIEQHNDKDGISWPISIAPFEVLILPTNVTESGLVETAEMIYAGLTDRGVEVLLDDRDERPGNKFKDADLIGVPLRVTVGERGAKEGVVELRLRKTGEVTRIPTEKAVEVICEAVDSEKKKLAV
jgi:prolyl-tRNA synthetase